MPLVSQFGSSIAGDFPIYLQGPKMNAQLNELLYQMLETEMGGVQVYTTALEGAARAEQARDQML